MKYKAGDLFSFSTRYRIEGYLFMIVGIRTRKQRYQAGIILNVHEYRIYYFDCPITQRSYATPGWYDCEIFERAMENGRYSIVCS
jgi:hypothetical protein